MSKTMKRRLRNLEQGLAPREDHMGRVVISDPEEGIESAQERFHREHPGHTGAVFFLPDNGRDRPALDD